MALTMGICPDCLARRVGLALTVLFLCDEGLAVFLGEVLLCCLVFGSESRGRCNRQHQSRRNDGDRFHGEPLFVKLRLE